MNPCGTSLSGNSIFNLKSFFFIYFDQFTLCQISQILPKLPIYSTSFSLSPLSLFPNKKIKQKQKLKINNNSNNNNKKLDRVPKQKAHQTNKQTNKQQKYRICFLLANYSRAGARPWSVVEILSVSPLEKTNFSFTSRYRLQIAAWSSVGFCVHFPFSNDSIQRYSSWSLHSYTTC